MEQKNDRPWIDFIVTHYDEPWETGKKFFDMLAMQRCIDFSKIRVVLVDGDPDPLYKTDWHELLKGYPFRTAVICVPASGPSELRNAGLKVSRADWVMFCDFDDMFADVVSVRGMLQVLPTDDADVIWMRSYREEVSRATNVEKNGVFVNCLDENFYHTFGKMYRRKELNRNGLEFNTDLKYEYESAFNHLALTVIPSHRVLGLTVDFLPYMKTLRMDSWKMRSSTLQDRLCETIDRDIYLAEEYKKRGYVREFRNMVAETIYDAYFMLRSEPLLKEEYAHYVSERFWPFAVGYRDVFDKLSAVESEVVLDNCINKMLGMVQNLYNYYSIEIMPPLTDRRYIVSWLDEFMGKIPVVVPPEHEEQAPVSLPATPRSNNPGEKVVIYCGTYNTYPNMVVSAKSVLAHTPVDKIYFLTEDDEFPYEIPDIIENINVKSQRYFPEGGPNFDNVWSYMCMMRAAFPQMFPQHDKALSLDIDIIVNEDISELWDIDLTDYYYAGVPEPCRQKTSADPVYCNFGVIMMNLDKLRRDGKDVEAIDLLNKSKLGCPEQDAFNRVCAYHILPLSPNYNFTPFSHITGEPDREIITHYAGLKYWKHFEPFRKYGGMSWQQVIESGRNNLILPVRNTIIPEQDNTEVSSMPRIAFMFGTRDWYHRMALSLKSLLKHTYLDKVYLMIEDDFFPEPLPPFVQCVNVSNQQYFPKDGPNYESIYSYMVLLRAALPLMFPDIDLALCIDADTLTRGDIGAIWDIDMSEKYLAAAKELRALHGADYYNCGVMLMNFANLRRDNVPEQAIKRLNETYYRWKEQDVLNDMCRYRIADLPSKFNHAPGITAGFGDPYIVRHYIGGPGAKNMMMNDAEQFEQMSWNEIVTGRCDVRHE